MVNRSSFGFLMVVLVLWVSCASTPSERASEKATPEPKNDETTPAEEVEPRPVQSEGGEQYFYGILQKRAHGVYDEMEGELRDCIHQFGPPGVVRELALEARRENRGVPFEVHQVEAYPEGAQCAQEIAEKFVETVGSSVFDDFDNYVLAVIARPEPGGECGDERRSEETVCVALDFEGGALPQGEGGEEREDGEEAAFATYCADELVTSVERAIRAGQGCLSPRNHRERALDENRLRSRAVILGDVRVVKGTPHVVLRVHRPWARPIATCFSEQLLDLEVSEELGSTACRAPLNNLGVSYSDQPVFTFVDGE